MPQEHPASNTGYVLTADASLERFNTFRVPAHAHWYAEVHDAAVLPELLSRGELRGLRTFVLGGGSNLLFVHDFEGLVVRLSAQGIEAQGPATVRVEAGADWDRFVRWSLAQGYAGLENLILIPGTVGAAPIQNIGAYGVEVREFVETVEAWDRRTGSFVRIGNADCRFHYRDSIFKHEPDRYVVTAVTFHLPREREPRLDYSGVRQELDAMDIRNPSHADIGRAVEALRRRKLPDPRLIGNAGSFFKNPQLPAAQAAGLLRAHPKLPVYPSPEGSTKLSAAWLIEACGFKGVRDGDAGVSEKHALVLVNHGHATGRQIWNLATRIRDTVQARFGVTLEPEPVIL